MHGEILTPGDVARLLGVTTRTLVNWRQADPPKGPKWFPLGEGGHARYERKDIDTWIARQKNAQETT